MTDKSQQIVVVIPVSNAGHARIVANLARKGLPVYGDTKTEASIIRDGCGKDPLVLAAVVKENNKPVVIAGYASWNLEPNQKLIPKAVLRTIAVDKSLTADDRKAVVVLLLNAITTQMALATGGYGYIRAAAFSDDIETQILLSASGFRPIQPTIGAKAFRFIRFVNPCEPEIDKAI